MTHSKCSRCSKPLPGPWIATDNGFRLRMGRQPKYCSKRCYVHTNASPENRRRWSLRKYGLTEADYAAILLKQGGLCKICGLPPKKRKLAVDHCHGNGTVRGLLCAACNVGLGMFKHNADLMVRAIGYLSDSESAPLVKG